MALRRSPREDEPLRLDKESIEFGAPLAPGMTPVICDDLRPENLSIGHLYALDSPKAHRLVVFTGKKGGGKYGAVLGGSEPSIRYEYHRIAITAGTGNITVLPNMSVTSIDDKQVFPVTKGEMIDAEKKLSVASAAAKAKETRDRLRGLVNTALSKIPFFGKKD